MKRKKKLMGGDIEFYSVGWRRTGMCCVKSAFGREKKDFPYECAEFCDKVRLDQLYAWLLASA